MQAAYPAQVWEKVKSLAVNVYDWATADVLLRRKCRIGPSIDQVALAEVPGVDILEVRVWTESEPCEHCYHPVRVLNSHINALNTTRNIHKDYTCCQCTHNMCVSHGEKKISIGRKHSG